jgi:hypothetical protein
VSITGQNDQAGSHSLAAEWLFHAQRKGSAASSTLSFLFFGTTVLNGSAGLSIDTTNGSIKVEVANAGGGLAEWSGTVTMQEIEVDDQSA